jgi:hypothetical protein
MFLQPNSVKNKQPKIKSENYLSLESEPGHTGVYAIDPETEEELLSNRYFLKRRVWRNMGKIRRVNSRADRVHQLPEKRTFRPRHLHMPV